MRALTLMIPLVALGITAVTLPAQTTSSGSSVEMVAPADLGDPATFLAQMREREQNLDEREQALRNREQALETLLAEVEARIADMETIRGRIADQLETINAQRQTRIAALAEMYGTMDPSSAAAQLSELETGTIIDILMTMERDAAAVVLENITPAQAAVIITQMSRRE